MAEPVDHASAPVEARELEFNAAIPISDGGVDLAAEDLAEPRPEHLGDLAVRREAASGVCAEDPGADDGIDRGRPRRSPRPRRGARARPGPRPHQPQFPIGVSQAAVASRPAAGASARPPRQAFCHDHASRSGASRHDCSTRPAARRGRSKPIKKARRGYPRRASGLTRRRPTLPHSCPCSTIGSEELNFRVRDGIGCGLLDVATGNCRASN